MSHVYLLVLQSHLDGGGQFEQAQVVGNGGTLLTYAFAEAFLRQSVLFQQMLGKRGLFLRSSSLPRCMFSMSAISMTFSSSAVRI